MASELEHMQGAALAMRLAGANAAGPMLIRTVYRDTAHMLKSSQVQNQVEYARTYCGLWIRADDVLGASRGEAVCKTCERARK